MQKIQVTPTGIRRHLHRYKPKHAIAEFIWNSFDAQASLVEVSFESNEIGHIFNLQIKDNGLGIYYKRLSSKFRPFLESEKEIDPNAPRLTSSVHGKNGVGRLTFFTFASKALWNTTYKENDKNYNYEIGVAAKDLDSYESSKPLETSSEVGTITTFDSVFGLTTYAFEGEIHQYLSREFGWYLELNSSKKNLIINGEPFDYSDLVGERERMDFNLDGSAFDMRYIRWNQKLNDEYSRYYFLDSKNNEKSTYTTTLNNKGDHFFHSVFIESPFFDKFGGRPNFSQTLFKELPEEKTYKDLMAKIEDYLRGKRKPFLKEMVDVVIDDLENTDAFPNFGNNEWDNIREEGLKNVIGELYQIEPKIFSDLNLQQKKTFVHLLNVVMDSGERDALLDIIGEIVNLTSEERQHLANTLKITNLSNVIRTIKLIEDRYKVIADLKELVFNKSLGANEVPHLQNVVEKHYWIFGEQYHLVTAAEPKFEEALRRFVYVLRGEKVNGKIDHQDRLKEMDIFMVRQQMIDKENLINSVCVELKHPNINLGEEELNQVKKYYRVISSADEFNGKNIFWEFYLIGNGFDSTKFIEGEIENAKHHGEKSLVYSVENCKIFAKKWSEVFAEFELRHNFLYEKLKIERDQLASENTTADEIVQKLSVNSTVRPNQVSIPS